MFRETNQSADSKTLDLILIAGLVLLIFFATALRDLVAALPFGNILRYASLFLVGAALYFLYTRRIVSYRYTLYVEEGREFPKGTFVVDRMVADKGREALRVAPGELMTLAPPGVALGISMKGAEKPRIHNKKLSIGPSETAHRLCYEKKDRAYALRFHPSKKLAALLDAAVKEAAMARSSKPQ
ncbi:MAG: hypothetical protein ABFC62_06045 [Clostridiaceae bacterium]|nr:hypothetical protein [Eubacteriales bacterium]